MATVLDRTVQALADASGLVVDRTVTPERIIGQAWIISKSRMVVLASCVANYADAPWALIVKFPYPDLVFSVKAISLHPEFNRRAARDHYLAQANEIVPQPLVMENDIATITVDAEILDLQPDRVQELNRALSLPLAISSQDLSGVMRAGETGEKLQQAITSQRNGVLNFYDERKVPFCRVLIKGGQILKASFQNLQNEFAICELMWRKPGGNFVLRTAENLDWRNIPEINMATPDLAKEASRRTNDLPRMLDALGGPNVRYVRTRQQIDLNQINQQIRWVAERIWPVLDGALPLTKMSERLAIDTYTAMQAIWEMKHHGFVAMANSEQFHRSGQLGPALIPGSDIDLKFWDNLQGFYLDELSMQPVTAQGNFFGSARLLGQSILLHTMPLQSKCGAIVLKDGRLVGVHNGKFIANLQNPPPFALSQMSWIGSLSEMGAKRMRSAAIGAELATDGPEEQPLLASGRNSLTGIKLRSGIGSNESPFSSEQQPSSTPPSISTEPEILQKFNKIQMGIGGGLIGLLLGMISMSMIAAPKSTVAPSTSATTNLANTSLSGTDTGASTQTPAPSGEAFQNCLKIADFRDKAVAPFRFTDSSKDTAPKQSFGLESERDNQKIYFVVWPNAAVSEVVDSNITQPPFVPLRKSEGKQVGQGTSVHDFIWKAIRYRNKDDKDTIGFVGAFSSTEKDKSILVVAVPFKGEGDLDFKNTANAVERMFNESGSNQESTSTNTPAGAASDAELQAYRQKIGSIIKSAYKAPSDSDRANKCVVNFVIDPSGNISKIELKYSSGMDEVDKAVQKAISAKLPYPAPPATKSGQIPMQVTLESGDNNELTIDEP